MIEIYTDGSSSKGHGEGPGGYGAIMFLDGDFIAATRGGWLCTTNNQMEMMGLVAALKMLPVVDLPYCKKHGYDPCECLYQKLVSRPVYEDVVIKSDSKYVVQGSTTWVHSWKMNNWKTYQKKPVKNRDIWEKIDKLMLTRVPEVKWGKGHAGIYGNELADRLAYSAKQKVKSLQQNFEEEVLELPKLP